MYSFPNLGQSIVPCRVLTVASCPAYQVSHETGKVVWYSHLLKNFPQFVVIHTVKGFSLVNEAEVDVFFEFLCFFYDPIDVGNLTSGSPALSKSSLYIWKLSVHVLLKPSLKDFEYTIASIWNECNCTVVWIVFGIAILCDWNENWPFAALWPLLGFPNVLACWVQHFNIIIFLGSGIAQMELHHLQ